MSIDTDNSDKVQTSIGEITLPTYKLTGENPNPVFHSRYGVAHIYPYTLQDEIDSNPTDVQYRTLVIENKYLRVTVLPELGGRVYSVFDKISDGEVFYKNPVIKFSPLAIRGAFFSGGVEFSFPVAHAPTTADPVNWDIRRELDGSASIFIGGLEHISGMRWTIRLTLFPDRCALAQDVRLFNPTPIPGRYHYWTNASLDSDAKTEFVYPLQRVRSYEFAGTASWPVARLDLITSEPGLPGMEGVPMWPADRIHDPFNFRWEKDMLAQVSIFGRQVEWDYFGAWQHNSNKGYAHYADSKDVSGMKLWSWGTSEVGVVNQSALMDDGSLYAETQCGAMETQLDFDFLEPGITKTWREWWLPLRDIGGLTCASENIGARLFIEQGGDKSKIKLTIALCPVCSFTDANIKLSIPGNVLLDKKVSISPDQSWSGTVSIDSVTLRDQPITINVEDSSGRNVLKYTHKREPSSVEFVERALDIPPATADDHYQLGLKHENFDNRTEAIESYTDALLLDGQHGPAHYQLGLISLRNADIHSAREHLEQASKIGIASAYYYLGLIAWYEGEFDLAKNYYEKVSSNDVLSSSAIRGLACIALHTAQWNDAINLLSNIKDEDDETQSAVLLGMSLHRTGNEKDAKRIFKQILVTDPFNLPVLQEMSSLNAGIDATVSKKLQRLLADDEQYILDLVCFYLDTGLVKDALSILQKAAVDWDYPGVYYLGAYLFQLSGEEEIAQNWREKAKEINPDKVFLSRLWEIIALRDALDHNPVDYKAKYYLANFLYAHQQYEEAIQVWEDAQNGLADFDVLSRNLGMAYWQQKDDPDRAVELFEKALKQNPLNQDIYIHLDDLYSLLEQPDKRSILLQAMLDLEPMREDVRKRTLSMMVDLGQYTQALKIFAEEDFVPLEMDQSFHWVYVRALIQRADSHIKADRIEEAIQDYKMALEFPKNHGVGRPTTMQNAEVLYNLGCAYELKGDFTEAIRAWNEAANEHHPIHSQLYKFLSMSLDKLGRYSELGFQI